MEKILISSDSSLCVEFGSSISEEDVYKRQGYGICDST